MKQLRSDDNILTGKKVIITQNALHFLAGSEITTLELAEELRDLGAYVIVFTWCLKSPMESIFKEHDIEVTMDDNNPKLRDADYVWVHHQVLPRVILDEIVAGRSKARLIFFHMSALEDLYLEQPYVYQLEEKLASVSLFVSIEARRTITELFPALEKKSQVFENPIPQKFAEQENTRSGFRNVLIVSNHPPEEIIEAKELLESRGIFVDMLGKDTKPKLVEPEVLMNYDVVISIGKTVQYCLGTNTPIYVYDKFGGPGFLTSKNLASARETNFSGRGFKKKTPEIIVRELEEQLIACREFQTNKLKNFRDDFSLRERLLLVLKNLSPRKDTELPVDYVSSAWATLELVHDKVRAENDLVDTLNALTSVKNQCRELETRVSELSGAYYALRNSKTIKIAEKLKSVFSKENKEYVIEYLKAPKKNPVKIVGLVREKNESLILRDTLESLGKIVDGFVILDDNSSDDSVRIAKEFDNCLAIIHHKKTVDGDRSMEESIHRQWLLDVGKEYNPDWLFYQDADERVEDGENVRKFMLENIDNSQLLGIRFSLFDAYMTVDDCEGFVVGKKLFDFRKFFGQERRDILMAWKNTPSATFKTRPDMREPGCVDEEKILTRFYVQHYGKSLSIEQWEETCDYYIAHFPGYAQKWKARKGKAIHDGVSDFGSALMTWEELKKSGGILI